MATGFGRKGLSAEDLAAVVPTGFGRARVDQPSGGDERSPQLLAFLAAERAQRTSEPGLSEIAETTPRGAMPSAERIPSGSAPVAIVQEPERLMIIAYVLWWFAAPLGAHRHYCGAHMSGFVQMGVWIAALGIMLFAAAANSMAGVVLGLAVLVGAGLWFVADAFLIPGMLRQFNQRPSAQAFT